MADDPIRRIYKYEVVPGATLQALTLRMPKGADVLCVAEQFEKVHLWAIVDTNAPEVDHTVAFIGTGWDPIPWASSETHVGTVQLAGGALVFHVFVKPEGEWPHKRACECATNT